VRAGRKKPAGSVAGVENNPGRTGRSGPVKRLYLASLSSSSTCGNAYLVWDDAFRPILVDCGISLRRLTGSLRELGMEPRDVSALFITHEHSDHIRAMCLATPVAQRFGIPVYASQGFWEWYRENMARRIALDLVRVISPGQSVLVSGLTVSAFAKPHDAREPLGFVVESGGERAGFAMDLGHVPYGVETLLTGLEHLVFESNHDVEMERTSGRPYFIIRRVLGDLGHLSNEQAADSLSRMVTARTREVVLAHLSIQCNTPAMARDAVASRLQAAGKHPAIYTAPPGGLAVYR